ncbi:MAG: hypothetical protein IH631_06835 [Candidatus Thorarchaeota archaeon]|nr:hypothetical protein [Candidatus Thorarchaeota archaeon]
MDFKKCTCEGCSNLDTIPSPRSPEFFVNLYIHNILAAVRLADAPSFNLNIIGTKEANDGQQIRRAVRRKTSSESEEMIRPDSIQPIWMTAEESLEHRKIKNEQETPQDSHYMTLQNFFIQIKSIPSQKMTIEKEL